MQSKIYSVRDSKGEFYEKPFYAHTHGEAERMFHQAVNSPETSLNKYPTDFDLYHLGDYDNITGKIQALDTPYHIKKAVHCLSPKDQ